MIRLKHMKSNSKMTMVTIDFDAIDAGNFSLYQEIKCCNGEKTLIKPPIFIELALCSKEGFMMMGCAAIFRKE